MKLNENFEFDINEYGAPIQYRPVTAEQLAYYQGRIPSALLDYWKVHGFGHFSDGLLDVCDPDEMRPVLEIIFDGDPDFDAETCHVVSWSAFGELKIWSETYKRLTINLVDSEADCSYLTNPDSVLADDDHLISTCIKANPDRIDEFDHDGKRLYKRCQKKLGKLEQGECYGFVPLLAFGLTVPDISNIKRMRALEHFSILAQAAPIILTDTQMELDENLLPISMETTQVRSLGEQ